MCRELIQWWQSRTVPAVPVAGWTSSAGEGSPASAGPFSQWSLSDCPTSGPGRWWGPEPEWLHGGHSAVHDGRWGRAGGFKLKSMIFSTVLSVFSSRLFQAAPDSQLLNLLSVSWFVTILDEADQCGVIYKLQELDRGVFRSVFPNPVPGGTPTVHILDVSLICPIYFWSLSLY